ncbi:MAG: DsbA family protein [Candidatus Woesearchaeota archaeon]
MICVLSLIVFSILSIFSAKHRPLAKEAFDCVFRKITFRKCSSRLDKRLKSDITGKLMKRNPGVAKFIHKHFESISWFFLILFFVSLFFSIQGLYYFTVYGNCNGISSEGFCIFDPTGGNLAISSENIEHDELCGLTARNPDLLLYQEFNRSLFSTVNPGRENIVTFIGCFECKYTRAQHETIARLRDRDDVSFTFAHFQTVGNHSDASAILACLNDENPSFVSEFSDIMFQSSEAEIQNMSFKISIAQNISGLDQSEIETCIHEKEQIVTDQKFNLELVGIYGTPTVFVNGNPIVGPRPYRVYWLQLNNHLIVFNIALVIAILLLFASMILFLK